MIYEVGIDIAKETIQRGRRCDSATQPEDYNYGDQKISV